MGVQKDLENNSQNMSWKNWPHWLKGGIIGFLIPFTALISHLPLEPLSKLGPMSLIINIPLSIIYFITIFPTMAPIRIANDSIKLADNTSFSWYFDLEQCNLFCTPTIKGYIFSAIILAVVGLLMGFLWGKLKNWEKNRNFPTL